METNNKDHYSVRFADLFEVWKEEANTCVRQTAVFDFLLENVIAIDVSDEYTVYLKEKNRIICKYINDRWGKSHRRVDVFLKQNANWLLTKTEIMKPELSYSIPSTSKVGRKSLTFNEKSARTQRREPAELSKQQDDNIDLMVSAASTAARKRGQIDFAVTLKRTLNNSNEMSNIRKLVVVVHSKKIIENMVLPIGYFGEEASESRNKIYKSDRVHYARKNSRISNLTDVINRAFDTSDPLFSSISLDKRIKKQKRMQLPKEVIALLSSADGDADTFSANDVDKNDENDECNLGLNCGYEELLNNLELENDSI
ncbi:uncharacterized protein LOC125778738 [Bactrocera dorsalis]|uniref:Uncharacterized protein LOC125778738 n=1 Tax=Bactrocera dorsalis TaxID=27457 RepID=A0ABM3JX86_BACDO|nr:uncharacterized protein LOC125778738 [Bactrocera dorsalis]